MKAVLVIYKLLKLKVCNVKTNNSALTLGSLIGNVNNWEYI